jgi:hypothetical protein
MPESLPKVEAKNVVNKLLADFFDYCITRLDRFGSVLQDRLV